MYVAYTAPHWPLHARPEDIAKYKGRFDTGWDMLREDKLKRMEKFGLIRPEWSLTGKDPDVLPWDELIIKNGNFPGWKFMQQWSIVWIAA